MILKFRTKLLQIHLLHSQIIVHVPHQIIKDVPLMNHDGDESFELGSLDFAQISCCLVNQCVEQLQEILVGLRHYFTVVLGLLQSFGRISCPNHL